MTHPILTQVSTTQARLEIEGAKKRIEEELSKPVFCFAYPNGQVDDFNVRVTKMVAQAKYQAAYTLVNGPDSYKSVQDAPFEIRRIFISHKDTLPRFAFKVCGINRLGIFD
ncbi:MAG: polysaccharide deacetylase family protein [Chloroflexi bacterium]|nr:polysaccharide deacetylase family protein [Chloroflexota bacterium]